MAIASGAAFNLIADTAVLKMKQVRNAVKLLGDHMRSDHSEKKRDNALERSFRRRIIVGLAIQVFPSRTEPLLKRKRHKIAVKRNRAR